jgi:L-cystine uptake protein TcyP (sodium:dicarboxylate symporter family)
LKIVKITRCLAIVFMAVHEIMVPFAKENPFAYFTKGWERKN